MRINCINCGHRFELDAAYDDYSGLVKCAVCRSLLTISAENGRLKSVAPPGTAGHYDTPAEAQAKRPTAV